MNERTRLKQKQYWIDHKEELATKKKLYYQRKKEHILEYQKQYRDEHRDDAQRQEIAQEYYQNHKEAMDARTKARYRPKVLHRLMIKEFKSKYWPWNEDHAVGVYQVDFV